MALVATHLLTWRDVTDVALALGPILLPTAVVPTLACAVGAEPPPPWPRLPLSWDALHRHFTYVRGSDRWWTVFTSALCHADARHRDQNLAGVLSAGWSAQRALGPEGTAFTFFGGHAAAMLNSSGHQAQLSNWIRSATGGLTPAWLASQAARAWDTAKMQPALGGSAGVFALLGVDLCLAVEDAVRICRRWQTGRHGDEAPPADIVFALAWLGVHAAATVSLVLAERRSFASGSASVSHVGHLTGFCWGLGCYAALRWRQGRWPPRLSVMAPRRTFAGQGRRLGDRR